MHAHLELAPCVEEKDIGLLEFLKKWDLDYKIALNKIPLFNLQLENNWSREQKIRFVKIFYHIRGHFSNFLWYLGNHAPSHREKLIILQNIAEEFGNEGQSHEQLYFDFAASLGVDLKEEICTEDNYLPFAREFNSCHLNWLNTHDWECCLAAFSAYERLDNMDYAALLELVVTLGVPKKGQVFFWVHNQATHFDQLSDDVIKIWNISNEKIMQGFNFISQLQLQMWKTFSTNIIDYD